MPAPENTTVLTVSALALQVKELLEGNFPAVWVAGEISNFTRASSGHIYLSLKDAQSQIRCAFFRGFNLRLKFDPHDGLEVIARGRVSFYGPRGDCQFYIEELQPKGLGAAELALRQLKERLFKKGYFDPKRKKPLPKFPKRVALIASATGAAIRDMLELLAQRWPLAEVIVRHSRVQGEGAAQEIADSVRLLNTLHKQGELQLDALVIGRGGGSSEDLAAFNEEVVADAIFASAVPVVSAVGHEVDVTIADLVADRRAETPSAAIVALTPDRRDLMQGLLDLRTRMQDAVCRRIEYDRNRVDQLAGRPAFRKPLERIRDLEQKLDDTTARLHRAMKFRLDRAREKTTALAEQLESLSPLNVLKRGYSLTLTSDSGRVIRSTDAVQPGDRIVTRLTSGEIVSRVEETKAPPK
jgi:exodeoxyribonuclease VII large subunit